MRGREAGSAFCKLLSRADILVGVSQGEWEAAINCSTLAMPNCDRSQYPSGTSACPSRSKSSTRTAVILADGVFTLPLHPYRNIDRYM